MILEDPAVVFNRKPSKSFEDRAEAQSALVEMLMDADELERRRLLLIALQTGEPVPLRRPAPVRKPGLRYGRKAPGTCP
jgi:hypothetical protein